MSLKPNNSLDLHIQLNYSLRHVFICYNFPEKVKTEFDLSLMCVSDSF